MKQNRISTRFFNLRLFLEGLKRLRVIGAVTGTVAIIVSVLCPIIDWIECSRSDYAYFHTVADRFLACPTAIMAFVAPFFMFTLFSFLHKRKESDFFHAIPYTRTCVYVSFVSAALTLVSTIQLLSSLSAGVLWALNPYAVCHLESLVPYTLVSILAAALLSGFMLVALTVSGTEGSTMMLFASFTVFVRLLACVFANMLDMTASVMDMDSLYFLYPSWLSPFALLFYFFGDNDYTLYAPTAIIYNVIVALVLIAVGGLLYSRRRSEMAGNPAPGKRTQAFFRILFTLMPASGIVYVLVTGSGGNGSALLLLTIVTLMCYFLYEFITTKRAKNLIRAIPALGIVVGACVVYGLAAFACEAQAQYEDVDASEIRAVTFTDLFYGQNSYQKILSEELEISDETVRSIVAESLKLAQDAHDRTSCYGMTARIHMHDGRTLYRNIRIEQSRYIELYDRLNELEAITDTRYHLPDSDDIDSITMSVFPQPSSKSYYFRKEADAQELYSIFRSEFEGLSPAQKERVMLHHMPILRLSDDVKEESQTHKSSITLAVSGEIMLRDSCLGRRKEAFSSIYVITDDLPLTKAYILSRWQELSNSYFVHIPGYRNEFDSLDCLKTLVEAEFRDKFDQKQLYDVEVSLYAAADDKENQSFLLKTCSAENVQKILECVQSILENRSEPLTPDDLADSAILVFCMEGSDSANTLTHEISLQAVVTLTDEDIMRLGELFSKAPEKESCVPSAVHRLSLTAYPLTYSSIPR